MNALEQAEHDLAKAKEQAQVANTLEKELPYEVKHLFISGNSIWVTLDKALSLDEAITKMKSLNPIPMGQFKSGTTLIVNAEQRKEKVGQDKHFDGYVFTPYKLPYTLKVSPPYSFAEDTYELYGFIKIAHVIYKVKIPVVLPEKRLSEFVHKGSTSRSAIVKTVIAQSYAPFTHSFVWGGGGVSDGEFYSI